MRLASQFFLHYPAVRAIMNLSKKKLFISYIYGMSAKEALLTIKDLSRGYPDNAEKLFDAFNFTLHQGDFHVLMGRSGTGKTTLVKLITGELHAPRGTIHYRAEDLSSFTEIDMENYRKKI
jgi:ABC-type transport system involved in cytochrome bd biosynthesis fused ATPase/permease subunit